MAGPSPYVLQHGEDQPPAERIQLTAGPLTMVFEPDQAFLRHVRLGCTEILRGIYCAVRDRNWGTVRPVVSNVKLDRSQRSFRLEFDVRCKQDEIDFAWHGRIVGGQDGTVRYEMDGTALTRFLTRRTGFCVLHPIETCAGSACSVEHADGTTEHTSFPQHIAPRQPFMNVRALLYEVQPHVTAQIRFDGEVFETEDQRNWTDASFKTYCRPLAEPAPYELAAGQKIRQQITLSLHGDVPRNPPHADRDATVLLRVEPDRTQRLAKLGVSLGSATARMTKGQLQKLASLGLSHLRVDLDLRNAGWTESLEAGAAAARSIGAAMELAVVLPARPGPALVDLAGRLAELGCPIARVLVFHQGRSFTPGRYVDMTRDALRRLGVDAPVGTGSPAAFCELNRKRPDVQHAEVLCWAISPACHMADDASLLETLAIQAQQVASARRFAGRSSQAVTPITLRPDGGSDPRQRSLLAAAWTVGSIKYLSEAGAESLTYYRALGPAGVVADDDDPIAPAGVFPVYHVLADVGRFAGGNVVRINSSAPLVAAALALARQADRRILAVNLTPRTIKITVAGLGDTAGLVMLDETNARRAMMEPDKWRSRKPQPLDVTDGAARLSLRPYAIARIDWRLDGAQRAASNP